jgi:hypothetical protein
MASVVNIERQIRQCLQRIDVNPSTSQGYLNEMNDRQEVINTRIEAFEERLATIGKYRANHPCHSFGYSVSIR